jgi:hypothetical protein
MPDEAKKPDQTDENEFFTPGGDEDWKQIDVYGNNGATRNRPNTFDWDPLKPKVHGGMVITFKESTNILKVMCGGIKYEINWDNMWPELPTAEKPGGACDPEKDKPYTAIIKVSKVEYQIYVRQTACVLQINCSISYTLTTKKGRCDHSLKKWVFEGKEESTEVGKTRANIFTCPCGEK